MLLFVVDILQEAATFLAASETAKGLVERAWGVSVTDGLVVLPKVLSRKKQSLGACCITYCITYIILYTFKV